MNTGVSFLEEKSVPFNRGNSKEYKLELIELKLDPLNFRSLQNKSAFILAEQTTNRLARFFYAFGLLLLATIATFLCIKGSIDWATNSQTELNKMKDAQYRFIAEEINAKYAYVRTE